MHVQLAYVHVDTSNSTAVCGRRHPLVNDAHGTGLLPAGGLACRGLSCTHSTSQGTRNMKHASDTPPNTSVPDLPRRDLPDFWFGDVCGLSERWAKLERGHVSAAAVSPGGRPLRREGAKPWTREPSCSLRFCH